MFYKHVLDNGMRVVAEKMSSVKSVSIGVWVNVGSRDEGEQEEGISHFLEHMFFKGTKSRSAKDIAQEIDILGGELNAFTSRETTTFYTKVLDEHLPDAVDLLSDILHHSEFKTKEIEREKQVVLEEFKMSEDDPEDLVHDLHSQEIWKGHPLGRPILGTQKRIKSLRRSDILRFMGRRYNPQQIVISVAGKFVWSKLLSHLERSFGHFSSPRAETVVRQAPKARPGVKSKAKPLEQVHFCLGTEGVSQSSPDRYGVYILNMLLGGGMSSRLFQEVRERRGWAYSIYSMHSTYKDTGLFSVYAATGVQTAVKAIRLVLKEFKRLKDKGVGSDELNRTKSHIKGSIMLSLEGTNSRMSRLAKDEMCYGRFVPLNEILKSIDRVTPEKIQSLARQFFDPQFLSLTTLGPLKKKELPADLLV